MSESPMTTEDLLDAEQAYRDAATRELIQSLKLAIVALGCWQNSQRMQRERRSPGTNRDGQVADE